MEREEDPIERLVADVKAQAAAAEAHRTSCTLARCVPCAKAPCPGCGAPSEIGRFSGNAEYCAACDRKRAIKRKAAPALASIPEKFSAVTLDTPWLVSLVGASALADARALDGSTSTAFVGPPGSGKTSLAVAAFRAVVEAAAVEGPVPLPGLTRRGDGLTHRAFSAHALAKARAFHPLGEGEAPAVMAALNADLLLLDELGGEDARYASAVTEVIYERHAANRPTWVTTGVDPKAIANRYGGGIARRVFEDAKLFQLGPKR